MAMIGSKKKLTYRWNAGDLITPLEAARLCGYKSAKQFQDPKRRESFGYEFTVVWQGSRMFFLRSEIDQYLTEKVEAAKKLAEKRRKDLGLPK